MSSGINRISVLQQNMRAAEIDAALINYHRDLFYYSGIAQPSNLLVPAKGEPVLFVRRAMDFVRGVTSVEEVVAAEGFKPVIKRLQELCPQGGKLGLEEDVLPASLYNRIRSTFSGFKTVDISPLILRQRAVKDEGEIERIREAASLFTEAHSAILEFLAPGISEMELAAEVYRRVRRAGADFTTFHRRWDNTSTHEGLVSGSLTSYKISGLAMTVTGIGTGPAMPWGASPEKLRKGDLLMLDIGINRGGYHADMARTYSVGKATALQKERFNIVNEIMEAVIASAIPGIAAEELFFTAERKATELKVAEYFQGYGEMKGRYIGHGVGLDMDDPPVVMEGVKEKLEAGMVVSIEPKIIIPQWGAVDLEDTMVIREKVPEILTPIPIKLFEC